MFQKEVVHVLFHNGGHEEGEEGVSSSFEVVWHQVCFVQHVIVDLPEFVYYEGLRGWRRVVRIWW